MIPYSKLVKFILQTRIHWLAWNCFVMSPQNVLEAYTVYRLFHFLVLSSTTLKTLVFNLVQNSLATLLVYVVGWN